MEAFPTSSANIDQDQITEVRYVSWRPNRFDPAIDEPPLSLMQPVEPKPVTRGKDLKIMLIAHEDYDPDTNGWGEVRTVTAPFKNAESPFTDQDSKRDSGSVSG